MPEAFDTGPLSWVKDEIDQSLLKVLASFAEISDKPENFASLRFTEAHLYQVSGALDMVGLEGCKRYCSEIEKLTSKIQKALLPITPEVMQSLVTAVEALKQYLQELMNGSPDMPTKLYATLKPLVVAQDGTLEESELFYPDLTVNAPKDLPFNTVDTEAFNQEINEQRVVFQKALLDWLRTKEADGLILMQGALNAVLLVQQKNSLKTLWWVSTAFVDALNQSAIAEHAGAKKLCRKIDHFLKTATLGDSKPPPHLLRDMLYFVALSAAQSERISSVKNAFELDSLLPKVPHADYVATSTERAALAQIHAELPALKDLWSEISLGKIGDLAVFIAKLTPITSLEKKLNNAVVAKLFAILNDYLQTLNDNNDLLNDEASIEVAASLNLIEYIVEHYQQLDQEIQLKINTQTARLEALLKGEVLESAVNAFSSASLDTTVVQAVATQITDALQKVEKVFDSFFRNTANKAILDEVAKPIHQVAAAFEMLEMPEPSAIATLSARYADYFKSESSVFNQAQFELVAESLSMLSLYAEELPMIRTESLFALTQAKKRLEVGIESFDVSAESMGSQDMVVEFSDATVFERDLQATEILDVPVYQSEEIDADLAVNAATLDALLPADALEVSTNAVSINALEADLSIDDNAALETALNDAYKDASYKDVALDDELLEIFTIEAEEVLATLAENLQALRVNLTDNNALAEVRRAYHTLKGSGRTVGLLGLGEVAWSVEKLLNTVMEKKAFITASQLSFIEEVTAAFADWSDELQTNKVVHLSPAPYLAKAATLENEAPAKKEKPKAEEIVIDGTHKLSRAFFNIFITEAEQHLKTLVEAQQAITVNSDAAPSDASCRAAHTLGSNALTAGFAPMGDLARALEHWLDEHTSTWTKKHLTLYRNVVEALTEAIEKAKAYKNAKSPRALINALSVSTADMQKIASDSAEAAMQSAYAEATPLAIQMPELEISALEAVEPTVTETPAETSVEILATDAFEIDFDAVLASAAIEEPLITEPLVTTQQVDELSEDLISQIAENQAALEVSTDAVVESTPASDALEIDTPKVAATATKPVKSSAVSSVKTTTPKADEAPTAVSRTEISVDQELLQLFLEEARELVPQVGKDLRDWRANPNEIEYSDSLQRALHTLKGSARMAGQANIGDSVHSMEDRVIRALKSKVKLDDFDEMFVEFDRIGYMLEDVSGGAKITNAVADASEKVLNPTRATDRKAQFLRMRADVLDRLINEAGEVSIMRSRMDREMQSFKQSSSDLTESITRLRAYLRELEIEAETQLQSRMSLLQEANEQFDPLEFDRFTRLQELTRMMAESVNDVATIQHGLLINLDQTDAALQQQNRMNRELQQGLMSVRMLPFATISERLQRIVRQTARELNKRVEMEILGEAVEIDRGVLDKMGAPLEHLLRNAVAHGLESTEERLKLGKPEVGHIKLNIRVENDEITLVITDDGSGINLAKVKQKALAKHLFTNEQEITDQALMAVIFEPGFSTADTVSQISGRGVGLDAVRSDIATLGGRIDVSNVSGMGAMFNIYLPVTLSVAQVIMARAGNKVFAIPSVMVEQVQKLKPKDLTQAYLSHKVEWATREYPLHYLSKLIGDHENAAQLLDYTPVVLLRSGTYHSALHVDEIIGNQEVVMKQMGTQLSRVPGMIGATVLGDGAIVLVINPVQLANREALSVGAVNVSTQTPTVEDAKRVALVVDDSLTMRKVLSRLLEREDFDVVTANDGMDAIQKLQTITPDIILTDIEMPRMDGFEFARHVRDSVATANTPLIVISSRTAEKHRNVATELGVNAFLGKPVQDDELIAQVSALLAKKLH